MSASRIPRDFNARPESEQAWLRKNTWCGNCGAADLGMRDPHEYSEDGNIHVEGRCLRCGDAVRSAIFVAGPRQAMEVIFIHGPAASGKHTIASQLSRLTGLPLFHNHLAVDAALSLFEFGTLGFKNVRSAVWRAAFQEAARSNRSFIFTFHPEASVDPLLITELVESIELAGGTVVFVELRCAPEVVLERLGNPSRANFRKLTDSNLYRILEEQGAFAFPPLPTPLLRIDTSELPPEAAAKQIAMAIANR